MSIQEEIKKKTQECNNKLVQNLDLSEEEVEFLFLTALIQEEGSRES